MPDADDREGSNSNSWIQSFLLREARQVAQRANDRLWGLEGMLHSNADGTAPERRQSPRFSDCCDNVEVLRWPMQVDGELCRLIDISPAGIAFRSAEPLEPGTLLTLHPTESFPMATAVSSVVRHCHQDANAWLVGCEFT